MKLSYPAIFYPCEPDEGRGYTVDVPDLLGCVTEGDTLAEAIFMGVDAASGWIMGELEDGQPIPPASPLDSIQPGPGGFVSLLALDIDEYAKKHGRKTITKTLTLEIPAYLNTFADSQHINFSQALQESLTEKYRQQLGI